MTTQYHNHVLSDDTLGQLFSDARSYNGWHDKDVSEAQIAKPMTDEDGSDLGKHAAWPFRMGESQFHLFDQLWRSGNHFQREPTSDFDKFNRIA